MEYKAIIKSNSTSELTHWKYIKKKKVNGKWRYYYDVKDALGYDERANAANAIRNYNNAKDREKGYAQLPSKPEQVKWYNSEKHKQLSNETKVAGKIASDAIQKYYKTPIGKLDKADDIIDKGRNIVAKLLNKLSNKIKAKSEDDFHLKY